MVRRTIDLKQGWDCIQKIITKLKGIVEGLDDQFTSEEYMMLYTTIYNMCTQKPPHDYSQQLYEKYKEAFEEYINATVLPCIREKHDEDMLWKLVTGWYDHKSMVKWLSCFFHYLDRRFIAQRSLPSLGEVGLTCFRDLVYEEVKGKVTDAVIVLIDKEREGEKIDRELLKKVLNVYVQIGMGEMDHYEEDFEKHMLEDTGAYYSRKALNWISEDSCSDYVLKSEECLKKERDRVANYLHSSTEPKLIERVKRELLVVFSKQLLEKEHSGCCALLKDDRVDDLDRYLIAWRSLPPLGEVGLTCFHVLVYEEVKGKARDAVNVLIDKEREGEQIDRALLKNVLDIYVEIGMGEMDRYEEDFEKHMLEDTGAYYSRKASNWILEDSCPDYMRKSEECLKKERDRVANYLHSSTEPKLIERVQHELLVVFSSQLLEKEHSGCRALLRDDKVDDLSRMYRLFHKIPRGLDPVAAIFKQHVTAEGMVLVQQAEDAASSQAGSGVQEQVLIRKIIELHDKFMAYVAHSYQNHSLFHKAMKEAFEVFCNKTVAGSSSAELLATFCDNILKKGGNEKLSDEAIEETLEKVVKLLAYIGDKDLFAEFYRKKLARRLLFDRSANDDHERSILTKLKQQCGGQFTSKMEGMVTDLTLARENQTNFEGYLSRNPQAHPGIDLSVTVLTTGFWPSYKSSDLNLPAEMVRGVEVFKEFYDQKSKHRKLTWIYSLGSCHLVGKFEQIPIELIVSTYQAALLLLFNNSDRLSYSEIMTQSNLGHEDLVRLLHSLSCNKYKVLTKEPNTKTVNQTDYFEFNHKFTHRMRRIKIPLPPVDERKKVIEDVDKDRRYAIDAAIVRIMKIRKVLGHQQLVSECVEQLNRMFKPDIEAIKKRMEDLITRDYLERDKENPNLIRYLA